MTLRKTQEMQRAEDAIGKPFKKKLRAAVDQGGVKVLADRLGVNRGTIRQWMHKAQIEQRYVEIGPDGLYLAEEL